MSLLVWRRNAKRDEGLKRWKEAKEGEEVEITTLSKQLGPIAKPSIPFQPAGFFQVHVQAADGTLQNYSLYAELLEYLGTRGRDTAVEAEKRRNRDLFLCYQDVRLTIAYPEEGQETLDELTTFLPLIYVKVPEAVCVNLRILTGHAIFLPGGSASRHASWMSRELQDCHRRRMQELATTRATSCRPAVLPATTTRRKEGKDSSHDEFHRYEESPDSSGIE